MLFFKNINNGIIESISTGAGLIEITEEEYNKIFNIIESHEAELNKIYLLREDLTWEEKENNIDENIIEEEKDNNEEISDEEVLSILLGKEE